MVSLNILTLNIWGLPWPLSRQRQRRLGRIRACLADRQDDLIGVQELWGRTHRALPGLRRGKQSGDSGLAIGGQLAPAEAPTTHPFRIGRGPDRLKAKGVLSAWVEVEGFGALRVLITHMQAGQRHGAVRALQLDTLLELAGASSAPTVLMGDFNLHTDHREDIASAARLLDAGFRDVAQHLGQEAATFSDDNPFVAAQRQERFDRIYLRGDGLHPLQTAVLPGAPLSDHHPLWARIGLVP